MAIDLNYRPTEEEIKRDTKKAEADILKEIASRNKSKIPPKIPIPDEVAEMSNDDKNDYIYNYNRGKIQPTLDNTGNIICGIISLFPIQQDRFRPAGGG